MLKENAYSENKTKEETIFIWRLLGEERKGELK